MEEKAAGLYIHFPFCRSKCGYCDFYSVAYLPQQVSALVPKYIEEIHWWQKNLPALSQRIDSLYLGGGSPSLMSLNFLDLLVSTIFSCCVNVQEFTMEINPEHVPNKKYLEDLYALGVTKLSIGVQTFDDLFLQKLGRKGSSRISRQVIAWARQIGFSVISLDIIFGLPGQTIQHLERDLGIVLEMNIHHLSIYQLTLSIDQPMRHQIKDLHFWENAQAEMFVFIGNKMRDHGWLPYEISNFAKSENFFSRHNHHYWQGRDYLGIGPHAHSRIGDLRLSGPDISHYLTNNFKDSSFASHQLQKLYAWEQVGEKEQAAEFFVGNLRLRSGICWDELPLPKQNAKRTICIGSQKKLIDKLYDKWQSRIRYALEMDWLEKQGKRYLVTQQGMLFNDSLIQEFFDLLEFYEQF